MRPNDHEQFRQRDAASLLMMGSFFIVMGALLLVACFWIDHSKAMVVNIGAAAALLLIGAAMVWRGRLTKAGGPPSDAERGDT
jgi:hypothetical protein